MSAAPRDRNRRSGFTLVELVLAVAIIGGAFLSVLFLRASAVSRARHYVRDRHVQRIAQEKLDEVIIGVETETEGAFEREQDGTWVVEIQNLGTPEAPLFSCTITVQYQGENQEQTEDYTLSSWVGFAPAESILYNLVEDTILQQEGGF